MGAIVWILVGIVLVAIALQLAWMGITWMWAVLVRGLHVPVVAMVVAFFVFRIVNFLLKSVDKQMRLATWLSIIAGCFAGWWVVNFYYGYYGAYFGVSIFDDIQAKYLLGSGSQTMSREASTIVSYCMASVAAMVTTFRGRRASLTPEQLEEKRAKVLSSAKSFWDTLILFSYGEYIRRGKQVDIVFVVLPLIGAVAFLIGVWRLIAG